MLPLKWGGFDSALKTDLFFFAQVEDQREKVQCFDPRR